MKIAFIDHDHFLSENGLITYFHTLLLGIYYILFFNYNYVCEFTKIIIMTNFIKRRKIKSSVQLLLFIIVAQQ